MLRFALIYMSCPYVLCRGPYAPPYACQGKLAISNLTYQFCFYCSYSQMCMCMLTYLIQFYFIGGMCLKNKFPIICQFLSYIYIAIYKYIYACIYIYAYMHVCVVQPGRLIFVIQKQMLRGRYGFKPIWNTFCSVQLRRFVLRSFN